MAEHAEAIVRNGRVITFDPARPRAEALAIGDGRILAVGSNGDLEGFRGPATVVHDAAGGSVLPGFIESHVHLFAGAAELDALNLSGIRGEAALTEAVRARAAARPEEALVYGVCADYEAFAPGHATTRHDLDRVLPDRPLAIMAADHHTVWANTAALAAAGLLGGGDAGAGSEIVMGADGRATGELREAGAFGPLARMTPSGGREMLGYVTGEDPDPAPTPVERAADRTLLARGLAHAAAQGITTLHNMDGNLYQLELLEALETEGRLLCRTQIPFHLKNHHPLDRLEQAAELARGWQGASLWSGRVKMFMDGVIESHTAFMLRPYPDRPDTAGAAFFSAEHFAEACIRADRLGLQISVHAIGDAAVRRTLDGYQAARAANGARDSRHRIEHVEVIAEADLPRLAELGVIASMQPLHSPLGGFFAPPDPGTIFHEDQLPLAFAWRAIRETGVRLIFSTDWPVVPLPVMPSVKAAVALREDLGRSWGDHRQTLMEALAGYTCDGAYAEFAEAAKGRLAPGMLADLVVMSEDLEALDPGDLDRAAPVITLCGGRVTHRA